MTTPAIDALLAEAVGAGAWAGKVCGAGGGGCVFCLAPPERTEAIRQPMAARRRDRARDADRTRGVRVEGQGPEARLMSRPVDPVAEIQPDLLRGSKQTIVADLARAIDLLKQLPTEAERERAAVFMDGLSQMRSEWGGREAAPRRPPRRRRQRL